MVNPYRDTPSDTVQGITTLDATLWDLVVKADLAFNKELPHLAKAWYQSVVKAYPKGGDRWVVFRVIEDVTRNHGSYTVPRECKPWVTLAFLLCRQFGLDLRGPVMPSTTLDIGAELNRFARWTKHTWAEEVCTYFEVALRGVAKDLPAQYGVGGQEGWVTLYGYYVEGLSHTADRNLYYANERVSLTVVNHCND